MKIKMIIEGKNHDERIITFGNIRDYCVSFNEGGRNYNKDWFPSVCIFVGSDKIDISDSTLCYTIDIDLIDKDAYSDIREYYYDMIVFCLPKISKDTRNEFFWRDIVYQFKGQTFTYKELWSLLMYDDEDRYATIEKFINYDRNKVRRKKLKKLNKKT